MMSPTSELTMPVKAAPMITPMARSTTLPRSANFLKSSSMASFAPSRASDTTTIGGVCPGPRFREDGQNGGSLVDQAGVHHCLAHGLLRLFGRRHHRQPERIGALADQRHGVLDRRRAGLDEQVDVQRR